jgi:hypothetical protein
VTGVLVENSIDTGDDAQTSVLVNAFSSCSPAPTTQLKGQLTGGILNATTGQPVCYGMLLAIAGGDFYQHITKYFATQRLLPVYEVWDSVAETVTVRLRSDDSLIRQISMHDMSTFHDLFVVELVVDPTTGTPVLIAYGQDKGTPAAAWYFANTIIKDATLLTKTWFVCDWIDTSTNGPDASDTWDCASG